MDAGKALTSSRVYSRAPSFRANVCCASFFGGTRFMLSGSASLMAMAKPSNGSNNCKYRTEPSVGTAGIVVETAHAENKTKSENATHPAVRNTPAAVVASSAVRLAPRMLGMWDTDEAPRNLNAHECDARAETNSSSDGRTGQLERTLELGISGAGSVKTSMPTAMSAAEKMRSFCGKCEMPTAITVSWYS